MPRLLIVDDVPSNIRILMRSLGSDFNISVATNGSDALKVAADQRPDLILLDIMMPDMDGYEVCRRLKKDENTKKIPVIFITAKDEESDETKGLELGAVDYITKPFSISIVQARIKTHLDLKKAQEEAEQKNKELEVRNQFIRNTFGRYMSDELVDTILDTPEGLRLGGESKEVTILMTDLRGFTALSERLSPEEVVSILNNYLHVMTEIILKHHGTIIEFLGDGILTVFGAPLSREDDASRSVACVLEMQQTMSEVNKWNQESGYPQLRMGAGLNTGMVVAGNIGSAKRVKYAVVGSTINLAARIESLTVGEQILISESVLKSCKPHLRIDDRWTVHPKGVPSPITLYLVGGIGEPYNIQLSPPSEPQWLMAPKNVRVDFKVLEGKQVSDSIHKGDVQRLTLQEIEIKTETDIQMFDNLKLSLFHENKEITSELFGKVILADKNQCYHVVLTSLPPDVETFLEKIA